MYNTDVTKMFDPTAVTQFMQKLTDMSQFSASTQKQNETVQKLFSLWGEAYSSCSKQSAEMVQSAVADSIAYMREIGTAKSPEEAVKTQAAWTKKCTETCQTNAQQLATTFQKTQSQCTDLISKMVSEGIQATTAATKQATSAASSATGTKNS